MSTALTIIKPLVITPAMLVNTDVTEADYPVYAAGTTYVLGDRVIYNSVIYKSLVASNVGNTPGTTTGKWVAVSATNRWKLFDQVSSSQTAKSTSMTYSLRPGQFVTGIAAVNMVGVISIRIRMVSDSLGLVFDKTISRSRTPLAPGWWNWFFGRRTEALANQMVNLPGIPDAVITVDFSGQTNMAVGGLLLGTATSWGMCITTGMTTGIRDYSVKQTNEWGDVVLTQRSYAAKDRLTLIVERGDVKALRAYLASIRATPVLWLMPDDVVYGYYQDFEILISYATVCECSLTLEGLT